MCVTKRLQTCKLAELRVLRLIKTVADTIYHQPAAPAALHDLRKSNHYRFFKKQIQTNKSLLILNYFNFILFFILPI